MSELKLGKYQHFKGGFYNVLGVAKDSENLEEFVVYIHHDPVKGEKEKSMWIRPKKMFLEDVIVEGKKVPRFKFVNK
jgi:hypothetical protein